MITDATASTIRREMDAGNLVMAYDVSHSIIQADEADDEIRYLHVLILARMHLTERAIAEYDRLGVGAMPSVDAQALFARLLKDRALEASGPSRQPALIEAAKRYRNVFDATGALFPAINAASLFALSGDSEEASRLAQQTLAAPVPAVPEYYDLATIAEAQAVLGLHEETKASLQQARSLTGAGLSARSGTARQLGLVLKDQGLSDNQVQSVLAPLAAGRAVHYCGRMFASDPNVEANLRDEIRSFIAHSPVTAAFGSLACGADILIAEEMLAAGVPLYVFLAAPSDTFLETSVLNGGPDWDVRYQKCLAAASAVRVVNDAFHGHVPLAFALTSRMGMGLTKDFAMHNLCEPHQLAILDDVDARHGLAGAAADVEAWRNSGHDTTVIQASGLQRPDPSVSRDDDPSSITRREVSLLFADFAGFSALSDAALPTMVERALGASSDVLHAQGSSMLFCNTWGDAFFAVFETTASAREAALTLLSRLNNSDLPDIVQGLRISLHHGLAMEMRDPILGKPNYFGREVSRAARIEPVTPPNCIYASEAFVLCDVAVSASQDAFDYVGRVPLPKQFGDERLYLVKPVNSAAD